MCQRIYRIVALVLVPCLLADPAIASVPGRAHTLSVESSFQSQALTLSLGVGIFAATNPEAFLQVFQFLRPYLALLGVGVGVGTVLIPSIPREYAHQRAQVEKVVYRVLKDPLPVDVGRFESIDPELAKEVQKLNIYRTRELGEFDSILKTPAGIGIVLKTEDPQDTAKRAVYFSDAHYDYLGLLSAYGEIEFWRYVMAQLDPAWKERQEREQWGMEQLHLDMALQLMTRVQNNFRDVSEIIRSTALWFESPRRPTLKLNARDRQNRLSVIANHLHVIAKFVLDEKCDLKQEAALLKQKKDLDGYELFMYAHQHYIQPADFWHPSVRHTLSRANKVEAAALDLLGQMEVEIGKLALETDDQRLVHAKLVRAMRLLHTSEVNARDAVLRALGPLPSQRDFGSLLGYIGQRRRELRATRPALPELHEEENGHSPAPERVEPVMVLIRSLLHVQLTIAERELQMAENVIRQEKSDSSLPLFTGVPLEQREIVERKTLKKVNGMALGEAKAKVRLVKDLILATQTKSSQENPHPRIRSLMEFSKDLHLQISDELRDYDAQNPAHTIREMLRINLRPIIRIAQLEKQPGWADYELKPIDKMNDKLINLDRAHLNQYGTLGAFVQGYLETRVDKLTNHKKNSEYEAFRQALAHQDVESRKKLPAMALQLGQVFRMLHSSADQAAAVVLVSFDLLPPALFRAMAVEIHSELGGIETRAELLDMLQRIFPSSPGHPARQLQPLTSLELKPLGLEDNVRPPRRVLTAEQSKDVAQLSKHPWGQLVSTALGELAEVTAEKILSDLYTRPGASRLEYGFFLKNILMSFVVVYRNEIEDIRVGIDDTAASSHWVSLHFVMKRNRHVQRHSVVTLRRFDRGWYPTLELLKRDDLPPQRMSPEQLVSNLRGTPILLDEEPAVNSKSPAAGFMPMHPRPVRVHAKRAGLSRHQFDELIMDITETLPDLRREVFQNPDATPPFLHEFRSYHTPRITTPYLPWDDVSAIAQVTPTGMGLSLFIALKLLTGISPDFSYLPWVEAAAWAAAAIAALSLMRRLYGLRSRALSAAA